MLIFYHLYENNHSENPKIINVEDTIGKTLQGNWIFFFFKETARILINQKKNYIMKKCTQKLISKYSFGDKTFTKELYTIKDHTHVKKVGDTSEFLFGIY